MNIDFVKVAWDSKWLLLLGISVGLGIGYFQFTKSKPMFRSAAQIQIIDSISKNLPAAGLDSGLQSRNLSDEALVLRSEHLMLRAVELGELTSTPEFGGMSPPTIAAVLSSSKGLTIGPAMDSGQTSVFQIQYESTSATTTQRVVQSIVDAYGAHLQDQYRNVGQETLDLIQKARSDVSKKLTDVEAEFAEFRENSGLIYRGDEVMSVHRNNADKYLTQKQSLMMQVVNLSATVQSARRSIKSGAALESVMIAIQQGFDSGGNQIALDDPRGSWEIQKLKSQPVVSLAGQMRQQRQLPLEIERESLIDGVGPSHPSVETIDRRLSVIKEAIRSLEKTENRRRAELDEAMTAAESGQSVEVDPVKRMQEQVRFALGAIEQRLESVKGELIVVDQAFQDELSQAKEESSAELKSTQLIREIDRQQQLYDRIVARLDEVNMMTGGGGLKLFPLNTSKIGYQFAPSLSKSLVLGGFVGAMLSAGLALLRVLSDRSYYSPSEIAEHVSLPVIGHIQEMSPAKVSDNAVGVGMDHRLWTYFDPKGRHSEAFRGIRTALYFSNQANGHQIVQVTSATPSEGKTTIAANMAISIAQSGRSVLLLDADLRRPRVGKTMNVHGEKGTAWAIREAKLGSEHLEIALNEAIHDSVVDNLSVMPAGQKPDNPCELLSSPQFEDLLTALRHKFDIIIVDSPPLLAVSDPANVASRVDGVLMVMKLRKNIKPAIAQATQMLETLEANVLGVIVNGVGSRDARGYGKSGDEDGESNSGIGYRFGYGYSYGYSKDGQYGEYYEDDTTPDRKQRRNKHRSPAMNGTPVKAIN